MRFGFGKNWKKLVSILDEDRIVEAESSIKSMLSCENLKDKSFIDIGSGSGLFSLVAARLGAKVNSFDYDINSVECTAYLKNKYNFNDNNISKHYDLGIAINSKKNPEWVNVDNIKKYCDKVAVMQEGPFWYFQDYPLQNQIHYFNNLVDAEIGRASCRERV